MAVYTLPEFGTDWLEGMEDQYIIVSLKYSTKEFTMFWRPGSCGYTYSLLNAGRYTRKEIEGRLSYYNDGVATMAVPLTSTALGILGIGQFLIDYNMVDAFLTKRNLEKRT